MRWHGSGGCDLLFSPHERQGHADPGVDPANVPVNAGPSRRHELVFGTASIPSGAAAFDLLDRVFDAGVSVLDTGRIYQGGRSEETLGAWLTARRRHEQIVIATKGGHPDGAGHRLGARAIEDDVVASLRALKTDALDLFLLHRDDPAVSVESIVDALEALRRKGYLRAYGASNWSAGRIDAANAHAQSARSRGFSVSSPQYSLGQWAAPPWPGCRTIAGPAHSEERDWYRDSGLGLMCWSSLAGGLYTSRSLERVTRGERPRAPDCYLTESNLRVLHCAGEIARARDCPVEAVALAYVLAQGPAVSAIFSCSDGDALARNLAALEIELSDQERARLDSPAANPGAGSAERSSAERAAAAGNAADRNPAPPPPTLAS